MMKSCYRNSKGFTLVELLVVIAIIAVLAALLFPAIQGVMIRGRSTTLVNNGRGIWIGMFGHGLDPSRVTGSRADEMSFPRQGSDETRNQFENSTDFFRWLVREEILVVTFDFFGGPNVPPPDDPNDENSFTDENNAWKVVANLRERSRDSLPFLFTRNMTMTFDGSTPTLDRDVHPFRDFLAVSVSKGGSARSYLPDMLEDGELFNEQGDDDDLVVLDP